ncbi:NTE family protein [Rhodoblastus acidophilus]|uniref:NTE family protein n=1 Tax=Rhodoblastus acidophilus TaxID=1074 RepID=A0A212Q6J8_RHOAC|nr:patatin-like phospholipase family protein [Rhodoblastus acidophilus]MCW2316527.1 NTE family protein [Rhodoblastus acidophilus]PPQ36335.1 NTE family protein rssA [Rhodoblastus acidophilus]RAI19722.1 NTE family protein rssA [Rhodoblastus acidophilus]SNB54920.1 NTE family protein [Rhodoblastus acidophilus]
MFGLNWKNFERPGESLSAAGGGGAAVAVKTERRPRIGLALGAGAARGWSHIGVLQELDARRIPIDVIAGSSIGAVVGGCYAGGKLADLEAFARSLTKRRMISLMDLSFSGAGMLAGAKLRDELCRALAGQRIEDLPLQFGAVATEIGLGHEVWLRRGDLVQAIRASYALPGIFEPVRFDDRWLFDGALVNPVPVTLCRAMGAEIVVAVNLIGDAAYRGALISDLGGKGPLEPASKDEGAAPAPAPANDARRLRRQFLPGANGAPGIATALLEAFNITQDRIARSRLAGDPPDVLINARLAKIGFFEFHRAEELIALGREAARRALDDIAEMATLERKLHEMA